MAGEKIFINNFENISLIDPNKIINDNGFPEDRNVSQENLVFYANLECNVQTRSRLVSGEKGTQVEQISLAKINFLRPNDQNYLTSKWTELLPQNRNANNLTNELLGITNITYRCNASFTPTIDIIMEDVKGRALFESGNDSIYSVFFNLPYPTFYLTLKGYYGKAVRYQLILQKFQASFDQSSGNFIINLNFLTYKFNVLNDLQLSDILALPSMYMKESTSNLPTNSVDSTANSANQINGNSQNINTKLIFGGYEKIKEVYQIYKEKNLISKDFPELTLRQLIVKLENFEKDVLSSLGEISVEELTDAKTYRKELIEYKKKIVTLKPNSTKNTFLDTKQIFYLIDKSDNQPYEVFTYKSDIQNYDQVISSFATEMEIFNSSLNKNNTFGEKGKNNNYKISVAISVNSIIGSPIIETKDIDIKETAKKRFKTQSPTKTQIDQIKKDLERLQVKIDAANEIDQQSGKNKYPLGVPFFFRFDGPESFLGKLANVEKELDSKISIIEQKLTEEINNILKSKDKGIGFEPTIRNVICVILASADAFLRKLDDVHKQAFDNRNNPTKKKSCSYDVKKDANSPVFPWPQYTKEIIDASGNTKYDLQYPGDPNYINDTGGNDYSVWPEIEFVEEFVKGLTLREMPQLEITPQDNSEETIKRILISSFDYSSNTPYSVLQSQKFYYELWERITTISRYQGFGRGMKYKKILNFLQASEATNVIVGLGTSSVDLVEQLKNQILISTEYEKLLENISNDGVGNLWQNYIRGNLTTQYLKTEIQNASSLLTSELPTISQELITEKEPSKVEESINEYISETDKNTIEFTDTYPFIISDWNLDNLNDGEINNTFDKVIDVSKSLKYNLKSKKIVNYFGDATLNNQGDNQKNRPFTFIPKSTSYTDFSIESIKSTTQSNITQKNLNFTEGKIQKIDTNLGNLSFNSSILNTPFFIKSIQEGVNNEKNKSPYPYITASYLFLNSLPLSDLVFQFIDTDTENKRNYIGATIKKYGAIHSMPKLWIARIGSIWYRYKTYVESQTNSDILSAVMTPYNFNYNFDPINSQQSKNYEFKTFFGDYNIKLYESQNASTVGGLFTLEFRQLGFYPNILNDFYYFINGENLYDTNNSIQTDIQSKIDSEDVLLFNNSDSSIKKQFGYNPSALSNNLTILNYSILFKSKNSSLEVEGDEYYYSTPSFGSRYNQAATECFSNSQLTRPIDNSVLNGTIRLLWGCSNFGYFPNVDSLCNFDEIPKTSKDLQWKIFLDGDSIIPDTNINISFIDYILTIFTKQELDLFETEFLNFAKSSNDTKDNFTLQNILKESLKVKKTDFYNVNTDLMIQNFQVNQQKIFNSKINEYINKNILFQKGNPTNFDFKTWAEMSSDPKIFLDDFSTPSNYKLITENSLPFSGGQISLSYSQTNYKDAWIALKTHVGFFNFEKMTYSDNGSYITDFFIDMNVAFTESNVIKFAELIKIFASQKYLNQDDPNFGTTFKQNLTTYLTNLNQLRDEFFDGFYLKVNKNLPNITTVNLEGEEDSKTTGQLTKLEYYDLFKAINDKWVAANNYNSETIFEDILFFDRANSDIGNVVIVDIFEVIKYLKANVSTSLYQVVASIIQTNNFVIYPMPSYINFYNVQNVGEQPKKSTDELSFANDLFGIFTEVDYQGSKSKIVCQYTEKPSEQLKNPSQSNGYEDDSWNFGSVVNPCIRSGNINYALSNKVVGMNVDFGLQNQGVFKTIQVSQDLGKATSESMRMEYETANLSRGTKAFTQSVSLYNIYKSRSYSSTVTAFGNAMIQPTMYFNLRNVPLFSGPYLITDVEHVITPGDFTTKFTGTRQKLFTPPISNPLLSVFKNNFIDKLVDRLITKKELDKNLPTNTIQERDSIAQTINNNPVPSENPQCKPVSGYDNFTLKTTAKSYDETTNKIKELVVSETTKLGSLNMSYIIYTLFYIKSFEDNKFKFYENNVSEVPLGGSISSKWGGDLNTKLKNNYICLSSRQSNEAFATFDSVEKCIEFNFLRYKDVFGTLTSNTIISEKNSFVSGFTKTWIEKVPIDKVTSSPNIYDEFKKLYKDEFKELTNKVSKAYDSIYTYLNT